MYPFLVAWLFFSAFNVVVILLGLYLLFSNKILARFYRFDLSVMLSLIFHLILMGPIGTFLIFLAYVKESED